MRTFTNTLTAAALLLVVATSAFAAVDPSIGSNVRAAAGSNSSVQVEIDGNNVILYGYVENENSLRRIEEAAKRSGANRVTNSVVKTN